jgi:hypothetical protein
MYSIYYKVGNICSSHYSVKRLLVVAQCARGFELPTAVLAPYPHICEVLNQGHDALVVVVRDQRLVVVLAVLG